MGLGYQRQDRSVIDYNLYFLPELNFPVRGPRRYWGGDYAAFLGAAQTFGRFVEAPYPVRVAEHLGLQHINFGFAGAGADAFVENKRILRFANGARICFIQIMSGRSVTTPLLERVGKGGVVKFLSGPAEGRSMLAQPAYDILLRQYGEEAALDQVRAARQQWIVDHQALLRSIRVPKVLIWMSTRGPDYEFSTRSTGGLFGAYPQLIDEPTLAHIRSLADVFVDATYGKRFSQFLRNKTTGAPEMVFGVERFPHHAFRTRFTNSYYPSPEMHDFTVARIIAELARSGLMHPDRLAPATSPDSPRREPANAPEVAAPQPAAASPSTGTTGHHHFDASLSDVEFHNP